MHSPLHPTMLETGATSVLDLVGTVYELADVEVAAPPSAAFVHAVLSVRGAAALNGLHGDFSLAFWDGHRRELLLAPDHLGQRPMFIREDEDFFFYCSELSPLLADRAFDCRLDFESAFQYLAAGRPLLGRTLARGVTRVRAAHYLSWAPHRAWFEHRFYSPLGHDADKVPGPKGRAALSATLDHAIQARAVTGKQALLLSGGVDSSYLAATLSAAVGSASLEAYTIEFGGLPAANEGDYARLVAQELGINHRLIVLDVGEARAILEHVLQEAEPCSAWAAVTHRQLLAHIHGDGHTHLFSGLGCDEVFGGYRAFLRHYRLLRAQQSRWPATAQVDAIDGLMWNPAEARVSLFPGIPRFFDDASLRAALQPPYSSWNFILHDIQFFRDCRRLKPDSHLFELMVAHECQHRIPELLFTSFETAGRAAGVRTAYPFLDARVVVLATALGASERFWVEARRWRNKKAFRELAAARLPERILRRKPVSYNAPFLHWMAHPGFAKPVLASLQQSNLWNLGFLRRDWLEKVRSEVTSCFQKPKAASLKYVYQLWALITLAAWYDRWVDRKGGV